MEITKMWLVFLVQVLCMTCFGVTGSSSLSIRFGFDVITKVTVDPEVDMNTTQLITSKGYPCEEYDVVTEDGYILGVQRIPRGINDTQQACWVDNLANESLAFLMADAGFDVWLANARGNTYARRHKTLNPDSEAFWAFSWDEMALKDLPATVDTALSVSGASEVFLVGHSQGGAIGYAGLSANTTLASKVKMFAALAPAVLINDVKGPLSKLKPFSRDLLELAKLFGLKDVLPYGNFYKFIADNFCDHKIPGYLCENILFLICGFDGKQMNESRIPVYLGQTPAGTSVQNMAHYAQMIENEQCQMFDYGTEGNMRKYNQTTPPVYDIASMDVPVMLFHGTNDWLVVPTDVDRLEKQTKNLVFKKLVPGWEHLDFIWAMNAPEQCYNDIIVGFKNCL